MRLGQTLPTLTRPFYGDVRREMLERKWILPARHLSSRPSFAVESTGR